VRGGLITSASGVRVAKSSSQSAVADFSGIISAAIVNTPTSAIEMGMLPARLAIENHGAEFMRPGVPLAVLIFSDANDQSCDLSTAACTSSYADSSTRVFTPVQDFVDFFKSLPVPVSLFSMAGVGVAASNGQWANSCSDMEGIGSRYAQLQRGMGMQSVRSICPDQIPSGIDFVAQTVADRGSCFKLADEPSGGYFEVTVASHALSSSEYAYQSAGNVVCLTPGMVFPDAQTEVEIVYEAYIAP
jgi:hypothetical protein